MPLLPVARRTCGSTDTVLAQKDYEGSLLLKPFDKIVSPDGSQRTTSKRPFPAARWQPFESPAPRCVGWLSCCFGQRSKARWPDGAVLPYKDIIDHGGWAPTWYRKERNSCSAQATELRIQRCNFRQKSTAYYRSLCELRITKQLITPSL
jgi:hypothetical protein